MRDRNSKTPTTCKRRKREKNRRWFTVYRWNNYPVGFRVISHAKSTLNHAKTRLDERFKHFFQTVTEVYAVEQIPHLAENRLIFMYFCVSQASTYAFEILIASEVVFLDLNARRGDLFTEYHLKHLNNGLY